MSIPSSQDVMDGIINLALDAMQKITEVQETIQNLPSIGLGRKRRSLWNYLDKTRKMHSK